MSPPRRSPQLSARQNAYVYVACIVVVIAEALMLFVLITMIVCQLATKMKCLHIS